MTKKTLAKTNRKTARKVAQKPAAPTAAKSAAAQKASARKSASSSKAKKILPVKSAAVPAKSKSRVGKKKQTSARNFSSMRKALLHLREQITGQINFRSAEQGTDDYERDFALTDVSSGHNIVLEIDAAINRLDMGEYGVCGSCGCVIGKQRLMALPYTRMCLKCQSLSERSARRYNAGRGSVFLQGLGRNLGETQAEDE